MNTTLETAATPAPLAAARGHGMTNTLLMLGRRELWEHRGLWLAPLVVAVILIVMCIAAIFYTHPDLHVVDLSWFTAEQRAAAFAGANWSLASPLYLVAFIVVFFYVCDCLYAERKDRSILFWKSLPVSDELTVASKFLVAAVAVPLGVYLLAAVTTLVFICFWNLFVTLGGGPQLRMWDGPAWLSAEWRQLLVVTLTSLWYAPIYAYLMLISAWVRRSLYLWVTLPPTLAPLLEYLTFRTHYVWDFINYRCFGIWRIVGLGAMPGFEHSHHGHGAASELGTGHFAAAFANIDLWLGLLAAVALLYAAARIRRYRDDT
jgi:ABC-2 type transport system permease protein